MPVEATPKRLGIAGSSPAAQGLAFAAACFLATGLLSPRAALAQQTVIIGGGPAPLPTAGAMAPRAMTPNTVGSGAGGIVVNNSVLDSLGPSPITGGPSPNAGLPLAAPQTPVYGAGTASPGASGSYTTPGGTVGAYRSPATGQLMVTRPSTLLHPPMQAPQSRLAIAPTRRAAAPKAAQPARAGTAALPGGKLTSRLIATPPKKRPAVQAAPKAASKPPKAASARVKTATAPAKPSVPIPAKIAIAPAKPSVPIPAKTAIAPAKPSIPAPPPPSLLARTQDNTSGQTAAKTPSVAAPTAPIPKAQAPSTPPAAPKTPSVKAPTVVAPKVAAPAIPKAPTVKPVVSTLAAIPPAKEQAVTPPGGDLRLIFSAGSAELSSAAKKQLAGLARNLAQASSKRVQLLAFAADSGSGTSKARRLSLSRALAVRAFLIDKGVRSTRMDVRALGSKAGDGPADRVDIQPR